MHIFITGATGFIGRHLCQLLLGHNHTLTVLSRQPDERVLQICGDVGVIHSLDEITPEHRFDAIVNLAGEPVIGPRWSRSRKKALWDSRVTLTEKLVSRIAQAEVKPRVLISGSAVGYYGDQGDRILEEDTPPVATGFGQKLCAAWEQAAAKAEEHGVRVCCLRTGPVLGKGGGLLARMLPAFRLGLGGRLGDGKQWIAWIHIQDHIRITEFLLGNGRLKGPFNATAPNPVTNAELAATLAGLLKRPAFMHVPAPALRLMMGEMAEIVLASQRAVPKRLMEAGFHFNFETLEGALQDILAP